MTKKKKHVKEETTLSFFPCVLCGSHMVEAEGISCATCRDTLTNTVVEGDSLTSKADLSFLMDKLFNTGSSTGAGKGFFDGLFGKGATSNPDKGDKTAPLLTAKSVCSRAWSLMKKGADKVHAFMKKHVAQISVGVTSMLIGLPLATSFVSWAAIAATIGGGLMFVYHMIRAKGDMKRLSWSDYMTDVVGTVTASGVGMLLMTASVFWPLFLMQDLVEMGYLFNSTKA